MTKLTVKTTDDYYTALSIGRRVIQWCRPSVPLEPIYANVSSTQNTSTRRPNLRCKYKYKYNVYEYKCSKTVRVTF